MSGYLATGREVLRAAASLESPPQRLKRGSAAPLTVSHTVRGTLGRVSVLPDVFSFLLFSDLLFTSTGS